MWTLFRFRKSELERTIQNGSLEDTNVENGFNCRSFLKLAEYRRVPIAVTASKTARVVDNGVDNRVSIRIQSYSIQI